MTGRGISLTSDGGFIVAAQLWGSPSQGGADAYLLKFDNAGNIQWVRSIGGNYSERVYEVIEASDGSFVATGHSYTYGLTSNTPDLYVIKLDASGNLLWATAISGVNGGGSSSLTESIDGGYIIAGLTHSFGAQGGADIYLVKLRQNGSLEWTRVIGGAGYETATSIISLGNGYYAVTGRTESFGNGDYDIFVMVVDENGNPSIGPCPFTVGTGGTIVSGGIIDSGWTAQFVTPNVLDINANVTSGGNLYVCASLPIRFLGFQALCEDRGVLLEWQVDEPSLFRKIEIEKSTDGINFTPIHTFLLTSGQSNSSVFQFRDQESVYSSGNHYYRLKGENLDGEFIYSSVVKASCFGLEFTLTPNPASNFVRLNLSNLSGRIEIRILNTNGELVLSTKEYVPFYNTPLLIPIKHLPTGVYFLQVASETGEMKRFVFQKL